MFRRRSCSGTRWRISSGGGRSQGEPETGRKSAAFGRRLSSAGYQDLQFVREQLPPGPELGAERTADTL
jgi:hypothetical protein